MDIRNSNNNNIHILTERREVIPPRTLINVEVTVKSTRQLSEGTVVLVEDDNNMRYRLTRMNTRVKNGRNGVGEKMIQLLNMTDEEIEVTENEKLGEVEESVNEELIRESRMQFNPLDHSQAEHILSTQLTTDEGGATREEIEKKIGSPEMILNKGEQEELIELLYWNRDVMRKVLREHQE